jgi:hypothetical protein
MSAPVSVNPVLDDTGQYADKNQNGPVWFLAGTIGDQNKTAYRTCSIPRQNAVLFPVINYLRTSEPGFKNDLELAKHVEKDIDDIVVNEATVDGEEVSIFRVKSIPHVFRLIVTEENKLDIPIGASIAAADGYWVFIKSLAAGEHKINFHGSCSGGIKNAAAQYRITVG